MPDCPHCGTKNDAGHEFCIECGKPLSPPAPEEALLEAGIVCPKCDTYNEPNQKKCMRCGHSLSGMTGLLGAISSKPSRPAKEETVVEAKPKGLPGPRASDTVEEMKAATPVQAPQAEQPEKPAKKPTDSMPAAVGKPADSGLCPYCQARLPASAVFCLACGKKLEPTRPEVTAQATDVSVRMRLTRGYGQEDSTFPVGPSGVTVGSGEALIRITEDPFLSPVHMALRIESGRLIVEDRDSLNGTFLRVRGKTELRQGSEFIAGSQRMILLGLGGPTTDVRNPSTSDTRPYGGPQPRQLFIALRVLHRRSDGRPVSGAVMLRSGPVVSVGREGCNLNFPGDERLATKHFDLRLRPSGLEAVESGSAGVYVRISKPTELQNGDEIMIGEEIFRVEMG